MAGPPKELHRLVRLSGMLKPGVLLSLKVAAGDSVRRGQILAVLDSKDNIASPSDGKIARVLVQEGSKVSLGSRLLTIVEENTRGFRFGEHTPGGYTSFADIPEQYLPDQLGGPEVDVVNMGGAPEEGGNGWHLLLQKH
eukprot:Trichotokara_eunicae@DN4995_c0_g1_i3.p1